MATKSFDEMLVIDTPEAARNLEAAFYAAKERGPMVFEGPSIDELLEIGREHVRNDPECFQRMADKIIKEFEERGEEIPEIPEDLWNALQGKSKSSQADNQRK